MTNQHGIVPFGPGSGYRPGIGPIQPMVNSRETKGTGRMSVNTTLENKRNYQRPPLRKRVLAALTAARRSGPFDGPGYFEAVPVEPGPLVVHRLNWIPDGGRGRTVALLYTDRATAQALVKRLNNGTP